MENTKNFVCEETEVKERSSKNSSKISVKSKKCIYFSRYQYCKFGIKCDFLHGQHYPKKELKTKINDELKKVYTDPSGSVSSDSSIPNQVVSNRKKVCHYFKAGKCSKGEFCHYQHALDDTNIEASVNALSNHKNKRKHVPICHYFKKGNCLRGENCKFYHHVIQVTLDKKESNKYDKNCVEIPIISGSSNSNQNETISENNLPIGTRIINIVSNKKFYDLSLLKEDELCTLRDTEINLLKKRYPQYTLSETNSILFTFEPTDPDWPFDVKTLDLEVFFPENYPNTICKIDVIFSSNNIPEMLIRYLNQSISEWIENRSKELKLLNQVELMFRPFLKWFDKNLEDLFICGLRKVKRDIEAKKDGIEFIPAEKLFSSSIDTEKKSVKDQKIPTQEEKLHSNSKNENNENSSSPSLKNANVLENSALKQGIKILFEGLELVEGIATLSCNKLTVTVQCIRCKMSCSVKCIPGKNSSLKCTKCSKVIECNYNSSILHQFSNIAGNLHVVECQVVDINLVESTFHVDCLNCSKRITIDGLHYGQKQKRWCLYCNEKMIFSIENVKFQAVSSTYIAAKTASMKKTERRKDPLFKEGEPLPNFGACKHYKKSCRWLRFPCCGRLYPCDECHNEKEVDHEMKFASRMICGYCSKEQPFSKEKPCVSCSGSMTAKSGAHWEGGKGCRNKIKMSRDDKHKYVGTAKTVSKKAQSIKIGKKK